MSRDYGVNTVLTGANDIPLFYDEHPAVDRPFTLAMGQVVSRGDLVYFESEGSDYSEPVASEENVGDGTVSVDGFNEGFPLGTYTVEYVLGTTSWDTYLDGVQVDTGNTTGLQFIVGGAGITITAGDVAFADGDTFTIEQYATGSVYAYKASLETHVADKGVLVVARDTDATDGPEPTFGYAAGVFNQNAIGNWATIVASAGEYDDVITALGLKGIHVKEGLK